MEGYTAETYGDRVAALYDAWYPPLSDDDPAVQTLRALAGDGPVLELGIGTGRLALPLSRQGVEVHGIDASQEMIGKLRAKPGGERLQISLGDFGLVPADGRYSLVFVAFDTFFALLTQEEQVGCFTAVAEH